MRAENLMYSFSFFLSVSTFSQEHFPVAVVRASDLSSENMFLCFGNFIIKVLAGFSLASRMFGSESNGKELLLES